jgi:hypothetical protein
MLMSRVLDVILHSVSSHRAEGASPVPPRCYTQKKQIHALSCSFMRCPTEACESCRYRYRCILDMASGSLLRCAAGGLKTDPVMRFNMDLESCWTCRSHASVPPGSGSRDPGNEVFLGFKNACNGKLANCIRDG